MELLPLEQRPYFRPMYHFSLAWLEALQYGLPCLHAPLEIASEWCH